MPRARADTRDRGGPALRFQALEAPMIDDRQITPSSQQDGLVVWTKQNNEFGWHSYLGDLFASDAVPAYAAPARATDLHGLPPAFLAVGSCDGLRDEVIDYARSLNQADVPAELHVYPGATHGLGIYPRTTVGRQAIRDLDNWVSRQLHPSECASPTPTSPAEN